MTEEFDRVACVRRSDSEEEGEEAASDYDDGALSEESQRVLGKHAASSLTEGGFETSQPLC